MTVCDWPVQGCDTCCDLDVHPDVLAATQTMATEWLWEATNRQFGNCPVEILPCAKGCSGSGNQWVPYRTASGWTNVGCGTCADTCSCTSLSEIILPTPGTVLSVSSNGFSLPPEAWRVDNMRRLVRLDGGRWPTCQDFTADPPTFAVIYTPGYEVPLQGQLAAAALACQLARRACGEKCDLPANTTQVTRQGVTITIDPGKETGLWVVDQWVQLMNRPHATITSPDVGVLRSRPAELTSP